MVTTYSDLASTTGFWLTNVLACGSSPLAASPGPPLAIAIEAKGGAGGGLWPQSAARGGRGGYAAGSFDLPGGTVLEVIVAGGGGGGSSYVDEDSPGYVAGSAVNTAGGGAGPGTYGVNANGGDGRVVIVWQ